MSGPSAYSGSGLRSACWKAGGSMPTEISTPVPIDGWSLMKLEKPIAGIVAVPTTRSFVGGTYTGAASGVP